MLKVTTDHWIPPTDGDESPILIKSINLYAHLLVSSSLLIIRGECTVQMKSLTYLIIQSIFMLPSIHLHWCLAWRAAIAQLLVVNHCSACSWWYQGHQCSICANNEAPSATQGPAHVLMLCTLGWTRNCLCEGILLYILSHYMYTPLMVSLGGAKFGACVW